MPLLYLNDVAEMLGLGTDDELNQRGQGRDRRPADQADLERRLRPLGSVRRRRPVARRLRHRLPAARQGRRATTVPEQAHDHGARQPRQPGVLRRRLRQGRRGHRLRALRSGPRRPGRDRRPALLPRGTLDAFGSPLAKAQLGAALALYGDRTRAATAFAAAVDGLDDAGRSRRATAPTTAASCATPRRCWRSPPSSRRRASISRRWPRSSPSCATRERYTSTQEDAWTLLAAAALQPASDRRQRSPSTARRSTGTVYRRYDAGALRRRRRRRSPTPATSRPRRRSRSPAFRRRRRRPASNGFTISARLLPARRHAGRPRATSHQNDRFVVVLTVTPTELGSGQYVVADPLPAGFEIENPDLVAGRGRGRSSAG